MNAPTANAGDDGPDGENREASNRRDSDETEELRQAAGSGDREKVGELFERYRERLRLLVRLRMDRRVQGRIDTSDVLQESYLEALRCFPEYSSERFPSFYLWLRKLTLRKLRHCLRFHLGAQARDVRREIDFGRQMVPHATSEALAAQLLGKFTTPSEIAIRGEKLYRLQEALNSMSTTDREIIALRHFEQLTNAETADLLGIDKSAASQRHVRAMLKLRSILDPN